MKKLASLLILLCLLCTYTVPVSAFSKDISSLKNDENSVRYIACPEGGKHTCKQVGTCIVYSGTPSNPGSREITAGCVNKCSKCGLYVASQFAPQSASCLGQYTMDYNPSYIGSVYTFYGIMGSYWSLHEDAFIDGFEWTF